MPGDSPHRKGQFPLLHIAERLTYHSPGRCLLSFPSSISSTIGVHRLEAHVVAVYLDPLYTLIGAILISQRDV
jgi:hypothetical protein